MSGDGSVTLPFADGEYRFRLAIGELRMLQQSVNVARIEAGEKPVGPRRLLEDMGAGSWWIDDARETIRLGLIGGGVEPAKAVRLVRQYADPPRLIRGSLVLARAILIASLIGEPDDPVEGNGSTEKATTEATMTASPSPISTPPAAPSAGQAET